MPELNQRPKVTVENLLHLKRAERPDAEFWNKFERELRQKQLTALIEKRPWWQQVPQFLVRRAYVPVGATAILAFTLVSVKYYAPAQLAQAEPVPTSAPVAVQREASAPAAPVSSPLVNRSESVAAVVEEPSVAAPAPSGTSAEVVELMPLLVASREAERPSSRLLSANLARLEQADGDFTQAVLTNRLSPSVREPIAATVNEELASVPTTSSRRNRLLARYEGRQLNPEPTPPAVVKERLARRLGDMDSDRTSTRLAREIDSLGSPLPQVVALRF